MTNRMQLLSAITTIRPALVGKLNERQVLRVIRSRGALSRAEVVRESGLSAPTVSKAVASLLKAGLLEEADAVELRAGGRRRGCDWRPPPRRCSG